MQKLMMIGKPLLPRDKKVASGDSFIEKEGERKRNETLGTFSLGSFRGEGVTGP